MRAPDLTRLILLAAIWGGSFIFQRITSPVFGPVIAADLRVGIAAVALLVYFVSIGTRIDWRTHWKAFVIMGLLNTALPFLCFAYAALFIPASYSVVMNATVPIFGTIFATFLLSERFTFWQITGLVAGTVGVAMVVKLGSLELTPAAIQAILVCLFASSCYGLAGVLVKRNFSKVSSNAMAVGALLAATMWLLPLVPFSPIRGEITPVVIACLLAVSLICSGLAYVLLFQLIKNVGPIRTMTVTLLMPIFGMIWGAIFLHETITIAMMAGAALIISGTYLAARFGHRAIPPPTPVVEQAR